MTSKVDIEVIAAILAGTSFVTRRAEIYESDGTTLWLETAETPRMIGGQVSIDYSRSERRALDMTLDNSDGVLNHNPDGFWYDKVIKVFRGVRYRNIKTDPAILIIVDSATTGRKAYELFKKIGYTDVTTTSVAATVDDFYGYDIIVGYNGNAALSTLHAQLLQDAYLAGYAVFSIGNGNTATQLPLIIGTTTAKSTTAVYRINQVTNDNPLKSGWASSDLTGNTSTGQHVTALAAGVTPVASFTWNSIQGFVGAVRESTQGARWFHLQLELLPQTNVNLKTLVTNGLKWLYSYDDYRFWETQIGEFMIDNITSSNFPNTIKVTGRDYTKKLLLTKFASSVTFAAGTLVDTLVEALAANAGISRFALNAGSASLGSDMTFAQGDDRWKAIYDCCVSAGIEVYFDAGGNLVTRPFQDPVSSPATLTLSMEGAEANLTKIEISSSDTSLINHIVVTSENPDGLAEGFAYQAEVANDEPTSPTRRSRIGERTWHYKTAFATSDDQCRIIAENFLRVMALEEFNLSFAALVFPWVEAGDIVFFENPDATIKVPDRYLLTNIDIPLALAPMSGTCKRVSIVVGG